jgi:hypothetical protein
MTMQRTDIPAMAAYAGTAEFREQVNRFRENWYAFMKSISNLQTPQVDGNGRLVIMKKGQYDSIVIAYMKDRLNFYFPGWSWESPPSSIQFLGIEWIASSGVLCVVDPSLLQWGIIPPIRRFYSTAAKRVTHRTTKREKDANGKWQEIIVPHSAETIVDLGNDAKIVNTDCFKKAIQMLTGIGDDKYGYRIEEEGMGSYLEVFLATPSWDNLVTVLPTLGLETLSMLRLVGCQSIADLDKKYSENYLAVYEAILAAKGGGGTQ